jgi:signal transduction histidine kinase
MQRDVMRLQDLVDDLFALSRAEVGQLTLRCVPTDLGSVVRRIVENTAPLAWRSSRIEISAAVEPGLPLAVVDSGRIEQILRNILHNSLRHTPSGGVISVEASANTQSVLLDVWDTGEGICAKDLPHIWEPFYSKTRNHDGAGLGLALVKQLTSG